MWAIRGLTSCFWYRFFEYADASAEDAAIDGLTGMRLGDKVLGVKRATADYGMPGAAWVPPIGSTPGFAPGSLPGTETECVRLTNMVSLFLVIFGYFWLFLYFRMGNWTDVVFF